MNGDLVRELVRERFGPYPLLAREMPANRLPWAGESPEVKRRRRRVLCEALDGEALEDVA